MHFEVMDFAPTVKYFHCESPLYCTATIGEGSYLIDANIDVAGNCEHILIGRYCSIARKTNFMIGRNHDYRRVTTYPVFDERFSRHLKMSPPPAKSSSSNCSVNTRQTIIGNDVWIGRGVQIFSGIRIGNGAVIGANAVVAKDIPPYAIAVGNPVRVIKYRFDSEMIRKLQAIKWWNWSPEKILEEFSITDDPQDIIEKFYSPELEIVPKDEFGDQLRILKSRGFRIFSTIADFHTRSPLWKKIIEEFLKSDLRDTILVIHLPQDTSSEHLEEIREELNTQSNDKFIIAISSKDDRPFSLDSLRETDVFVTTREDDCSKAIDAMSDLNFETRYIFDDLVFF